jgi:hypothetical protein
MKVNNKILLYLRYIIYLNQILEKMEKRNNKKKQTIRQKHWKRFDLELRTFQIKQCRKLGVKIKIVNKVNNEEGD